MDSPIRATKQEDKHNIREEFRGGMLREVWDEIDAEGNVVKTAVWDILDRSGKPLGEQSWDEYEQYVDLMREAASVKKKKSGRKYTDEQLRKKREETAKRNEEKARKNRTDVAGILEYFLEENPEPFLQIPSYKFYDKMKPYIEKVGDLSLTQRRFLMILATNKEYFSEMGFTFGRGWSALSRIEIMYVGYMNTVALEDSRKKAKRDEEIVSLLSEIPVGEYTRLDLARRLIAGLPELNLSNLSWILARNADKFGLRYMYDTDVLVKETI